MIEKLVTNYTPEITEAINVIKHNCQTRLDIEMSDSDIRVYDIEGTVFIFGNPDIPGIGRNIRLEIKDRYLSKEEISKEEIMYSYRYIPELIIYHRFLIARIKDNEIVYGGDYED